MSRNKILLEQIKGICDNSIINKSTKGFSKQLLAEQAVLICKPILHDCYLKQSPQKKILHFLKQHEIKCFIVLVIRLYTFLKYFFNVDAA